MHIIIIGWLYVTLIVAFNEPSVVAGVISFLFYGALPCSLLIYFNLRKVRRERRAYRERLLADQRANDDNRGDAQHDQ